MSTIAYFTAVALIGTGAAVTSQVVTVIDAPVEERVEISAPLSPAASAYDFDKFAADVVSPVATTKISGNSKLGIERLAPVRVASVGKSQLHIIVRDTALAEKADDLAAAVDAQAAELPLVDDENFVVTGDEISAPSLESPAIIPLPSERPSSFALQTETKAKRRTVRPTKKAVRTKRNIRRPVRVAEASTTKRSRLARRLRRNGWLIGAFR